jgi:anti-anti-sigma factor
MPDLSAAAISHDVVLVLTIHAAEVRGEELTAELERTFAAELDRTAATKVIVDMSAVTYITSTGVSTLLALNQKIKRAGGRVVLCGLQELVSEVLHVMRFIDPTGRRPALFDVRPDAAAAAAYLLTHPVNGVAG